jgi:hypothetical protein
VSRPDPVLALLRSCRKLVDDIEERHRRRVYGATPRVPTGSLAQRRRGSSAPDPTGDEAVRLLDDRDGERRWVELQVAAALDLLRGVETVLPPIPVSEPGCTSCARFDVYSPRQSQRGRRDLCRWCDRWHLSSGDLPPEVAVRAHADGANVTRATLRDQNGPDRGPNGEISLSEDFPAVTEALVWKIADQFNLSGGDTREDLVQDGWAGALEAARTFDPARGEHKHHLTAGIRRGILNGLRERHGDERRGERMMTVPMDPKEDDGDNPYRGMEGELTRDTDD